jgi:glyoxylase-like metal-dependent hydrolase (beta-lactamase superfamily II)
VTGPARHLSLEPLAPGVWAALHRHGGWAIANAGIVDLGGSTLIFDTLLTPAAARELRAAALALTGRVPDLVVNSHYHNDHVRGNQVFPEATVLATSTTRALFLTQGIEELAYDRRNAPARLADLDERPNGDDETSRATAFLEPYFRGIAESMAELELRAPEVAVTGPTWFHGSERRAQLIPFSSGHSGDDAILVLPDDGVVFCADLLFVDTHPFLPDGDPDAFLDATRRLHGLNVRRYVPGHGPVAGAEALATQAGYLEALRDLTDRAVEAGTDSETFAATPIPEPYRPWDLGIPFFETNLRFLRSRALADGGGGG